VTFSPRDRLPAVWQELGRVSSNVSLASVHESSVGQPRSMPSAAPSSTPSRPPEEVAG
jgi:hypothetical protein